MEVSYAVSILTANDAEARRLLTIARGYCGIENRVHCVGDVALVEDRSQVLVARRNLVINVVPQAGHSNVAAALRRHTAHVGEAFAMVSLTDAAGE